MIQRPASALPPLGAGDARVQAYNFRLCLTQNRSNVRPFPAPSNYSGAEWELLRRAVMANAKTGLRFGNFFTDVHFVAAGKTDTNNAGGLSTDFVGGADQWPEAGVSPPPRAITPVCQVRSAAEYPIDRIWLRLTHLHN